jgi:outer membrane protein
MQNAITKFILCIALGIGSAGFAKTETQGAIVDFTTCLTQSKYGKKEQETLEKIRKQITSVLQETEKQLKDISEKLDDSDYMDSLSPKAEEELTIKRESLLQDMNRYQNEFYHTLSQAQYLLHQKLHVNVSKAAEKIAQEKKYPFVISKDSCFYYTPDLEITNEVLSEMDKNFELEHKAEAQMKEEITE